MPLSKEPFVGREREMARLQRAVDLACEGRGQLCLIVGEAGIGKTRLADELARSARVRLRVAVGRCTEGEGAPPFWPWIQIIRTYVRDQDASVLATDMGPWASDIAQIVPELHEHLPALPPAPALDPTHARFRVFDGVTSFLAKASQRQPLLLILDDLHWADRPSLLLLEFLTRALAGAAILVVGAYRDIEVRPAHPLLPALAELVREPVSDRIALAGLTPSDVATFIELHAGRSKSEALASTVYEKSEGNPFFITELVRLLADDASSEGTRPRPFAIPHGVQAVIARRLNRLSEECNRILTLAAAFGREFQLVPLVRVSDTTHQRTRDALAEAVDAGIIAETAGAIDRYHFSHALVRDSLYAELGAIRRVRLHRRIAEFLVDLHAADPAPHYDELTHHFFQSALGGECVDEAVDYAIGAAQYALTRFAYEQAAEHYDLALRALALAGSDEARRGQVLLALGDACARASNFDRAKSVFLEAAAIARQRGDAADFAAAALGFGGIVVGVGSVDQTLVSLLEESLERLPGDDNRLRAMALARLATELYFAPDPARRTELSRQAVEMARRLNDPTALIAALEAHHFCIWGLVTPAEQCALATEIVRLAEQRHDRERLLIGHQFRISDLLEMGDIAAVDAAVAAYEQLADELRQPAFSWRLATFKAMRALMSGSFAEAEELMATALALGQRVQRQTAANFFGVQLFSLRREQGRLAELEDSVRVFVETYPAVPSWRSALASLYAELGRSREAQMQFEQLALHDFATLPHDNSRLMGLALLAEACAALGDRPHAATLYELLLPDADRNVVAGTAAACNGSVARPLALLATTMGRWDEAETHFDAAVRAHENMGARPFLARTQLEYAIMLQARAAAESERADALGERARTLLEAAQQTAHSLGMVGVEEKARQALHDLVSPARRGRNEEGADAPREPDAPSVSPPLARGRRGNVFRRDGEIWTLAFGGDTCRLKDARGLHYLAALLRQPARELHVLDLVRGEGAPTAQRATSALDEQSVRAYRARLMQLRRAPHRSEETEREIAFLEREIARDTGLGGRKREVGSDSERARVGVTRAIKHALAAIATRHPALAGHLTAAVRTGAYCRYSPPDHERIEWQLDGDAPAP